MELRANMSIRACALDRCAHCLNSGRFPHPWNSHAQVHVYGRLRPGECIVRQGPQGDCVIQAGGARSPTCFDLLCLRQSGTPPRGETLRARPGYGRPGLRNVAWLATCSVIDTPKGCSFLAAAVTMASSMRKTGVAQARPGSPCA